MKTAGVWQQRPSARKTWRPLHPPLTTQQTLSEETAGPESLSIRNDKAADDDQNRQYWTWLLDCGKFVPSHRTKAGPGSDGVFFFTIISIISIYFLQVHHTFLQTNKQTSDQEPGSDVYWLQLFTWVFQVSNPSCSDKYSFLDQVSCCWPSPPLSLTCCFLMCVFMVVATGSLSLSLSQCSSSASSQVLFALCSCCSDFL